VKIGNLENPHGTFESFSDFASRTRTTFTPQQTHAFLNYADFPPSFAELFKKVVSLLHLPRESCMLLMIFQDIFKSIHALDVERYAALKAVFDARGRPKNLECRKIYVICEWDSVVRKEAYFFKT
jgi:hypothetical protein